jgi:hypothetical protein
MMDVAENGSQQQCWEEQGKLTTMDTVDGTPRRGFSNPMVRSSPGGEWLCMVHDGSISRETSADHDTLPHQESWLEEA